ncbi:MAG: putative porin [Cyclobacteriaceae bacterium]
MRKLLLFLSFLYAFESFSQLLDDSTVLVYGPFSTKFVYESDILNNQAEKDQYATIDTLLDVFDRQSFIDRNGRKYQNLGNLGTALTSVFFEPQELIGRTSGFNAFAPYSRKGLNTIKYYDTKSPFIDLLAFLGGGNKNIVNVDFSRNVREGWNLGFDLHKITADKIFARDAVGDRQTTGTSFDLYTHYQHQSAPYQAVLYYTKTTHNVFELGGMRFGNDSTIAELFRQNNGRLQLDDAQNKRDESTLHLYHDYQIAEQFQLYHSLDIYNEKNLYQDFTDGSLTEYDTYRDAYNGVFQIDADSTYERSRFSSTTNELGIKGDLSSIFYRAYVKLRTVDFDYFFLDPLSKTTETYLGGYTRFNWREKFKVIGEAEVMQTGEYLFGGALESNLLNLKYTSKSYRVPIIYENYFGNHYEWNNNFSPVFVNKLDGNVKLSYKAFSFIPKVSLTAYNDFVYFNQSQEPVQASDGIAIATIGGEVNTVIRGRKDEGFHIKNEVLVTNVSGGSADAVRIPELFYNGRYYWAGWVFNDKIPIQMGVDVHARSSYFANDYNPVNQQFFLQDNFEISSYFKGDLFLTMRVDKFYVGIKWSHFNQPPDDGYFVTPYYPGQPKNFDLLIRWTFFD